MTPTTKKRTTKKTKTKGHTEQDVRSTLALLKIARTVCSALIDERDDGEERELTSAEKELRLVRWAIIAASLTLKNGMDGEDATNARNEVTRRINARKQG